MARKLPVTQATPFSLGFSRAWPGPTRRPDRTEVSHSRARSPFEGLARLGRFMPWSGKARSYGYAIPPDDTVFGDRTDRLASARPLAPPGAGMLLATPNVMGPSCDPVRQHPRTRRGPHHHPASDPAPA